MGTGDLCRVPPAAVHHWIARQISGTGPYGYCRRSLEYRSRICIRGKFVSLRNPVKKTRGVRHVLKHSSDPRVANLEDKVQIWDLVRVVGIVAPFAPRGFSIRGKLVLSSPRG